MVLSPFLLFLCLLCVPISHVFAQATSSYTAYQTGFLYVTSCSESQYFDTALLQCASCPANAVQSSNDPTQCDCTNNTYYYGVNQGGGSLLCLSCGSNYVRSSDGFGCLSATATCSSSVSNVVTTESGIDGTPNVAVNVSSSQPRIGAAQCLTCQNGTWPDLSGQRCTPCASVTPRIGTPSGGITCCTANTTADGTCLTFVEDTTINSFVYLNTYTNPTTSSFFQQHLRAAFHLCRMNLNSTTAQSPTRVTLTNATACQVLGNIVAMQLYYGVNNYAYYFYDTYIWSPQTTPLIWTASTIRTSIPFLAYPSSFYADITSSTYNWIPSNFNRNDVLDLKLAKYSPTGQFLGLIDAFDVYMQLCGGAYTDGRAAFTFGAQYQKSCMVRADALWSSPLYETAFFDPYITFTQASASYMLPIPIVITNYKSTSGGFPNQNSDASVWTYHRRFFLLDRISGITTNNVLSNVRYAKSIQILNTITSSGSYIQPPVIVIEYGELSTSDIDQGTVVQISFQSQYQMNLDAQIRNIWIAVGVLSGLGVLLAFAQTSVWQTRSGKLLIDLATIGKLFLYMCNILATVFFIVMAGVSVWWLIFFKRQDVIYLVLPTTGQQASFTSLIVIAFALKTLDIFHLIIRQSSMDIFFIDWEKPKTGNKDSVSVWRTYFVANEFSEIQTFRRISLTFQLFFVLFLLKVINLENVATAEPGVNLYPSSSDYVPGYNNILRVGIAFTMWLATALIQYLYYVLFHQRFIEDELLNFIDLCSVSNISVFILTDDLYGYYIHGRSPHGTTDVNMKDMIMNLEREANHMSGARGLQAKSEEQTFIMNIEKRFRTQYEGLLRSYQSRIQTPTAKKGDEKESEILMTYYRSLNEFLCAFINHSLPSFNYTVRDRYFIEKILNYDFQVPMTNGISGATDTIFLVDAEKNFIRSIFVGHENSLLIWNMATFLFFDYFTTNYVLSAILTYILNFIAVKLRLSLGRKNLSAKTLIPKNFLI